MLLPDRPPPRVMLADDHPFFRAGLREVLESCGMEVVGEAHDGESAVSLARTLNPDLILMDVRMPRRSGIEATREIVSTQPEIKVLVLSVSPNDSDVAEALDAGASGYLLKGAGADELTGAVVQALRGNAVIGAGVARQVLGAGRHHAESGAVEHAGLTARELDVLRLMADGASNAEIGRELFISANTVKQHVASILQKLGARGRVDAAVLAVRRGLI
jgi:DNA-binding NarL/FixJ family response regulator